MLCTAVVNGKNVWLFATTNVPSLGDFPEDVLISAMQDLLNGAASSMLEILGASIRYSPDHSGTSLWRRYCKYRMFRK